MCIVVNNLFGFTQYLLFIQSSERGLFEAGYFATNVYNALQLFLVYNELWCDTCGRVRELFNELWCDTCGRVRELFNEL